MKNSNKCNFCGAENPFYVQSCNSCKSYLREKVPVIDLWNTFYKIIISPTQTINNIIFAENKNFVVLLLIIFSLKLYLNSYIMSNLWFKYNDSFARTFFNYNYLIYIISGTVFIFLLSLLFSLLLIILQKILDIKINAADVWAVNSYSLLPQIIALFCFMPITMGTLGDTIFTFYPSPYFYKPIVTILMLGFEIMAILYSWFLLFKSYYILTKHRYFSVLLSFLFIALLNLFSLFSFKLILDIYKFYR